jgi:hypothetical protein
VLDLRPALVHHAVHRRGRSSGSTGA